MYHGWSVVGVCMLVFGLANGITAYSYGVLVFPMGKEFGAGRGELMLGMTVSSFVSMLFAPLLGGLMDKGQARLLFSGAAILLGLELLLISFAGSVWAFVAIFALATPVVGTLLGPVGTNTVVARWFSRQRARALGILAMGTSIGGLLVPLLFQTLIDNVGWREACRWMALLVPVLLVPTVMLVIRNRPKDMGLHPDGDAATTESAAAQDGSAPMPAVFRDIGFWRISIAVGVLMAAFTAALAAAGLGGKLLFSVFATRINLKLALLAALVLMGLPLGALTLSHSYVAMLAAAVCLGLSSGAFLPAWSAIVARIYGPAVFGRVMGRMQAVTIPMVMIGTPATGYLFDITGSYDAAFLAFAVAAGLAMAVRMPLRVPAQPG